MRKPFTEVNTVLTRVMSKLGLDKRLREHTFLQLWPTFVSGVIGDRSRAIFIDAERNLVVSVADAATGQELSMCKPRVLAKLAPAARSLGIEIKGIRLDLKHYHATSTLVQHPLASDEKLPTPTEEELEAIELTSLEQQEISKLSEELMQQNADKATRERMVRLYEREFRVRTWRFAHNYPICQQCGNPVWKLHKLATPHTDAKHAMVCISCMYAS
jgi:hypothetical protein